MGSETTKQFFLPNALLNLAFCHSVTFYEPARLQRTTSVWSHTTTRVHGSSQILIEHGDYIRVELMHKDNLMETATLLSKMGEDYTQNDRSAFWAAKRLALGQPQQRSPP